MDFRENLLSGLDAGQATLITLTSAGEAQLERVGDA
jgi:hypothetical protein